MIEIIGTVITTDIFNQLKDYLSLKINKAKLLQKIGETFRSKIKLDEDGFSDNEMDFQSLEFFFNKTCLEEIERFVFLQGESLQNELTSLTNSVCENAKIAIDPVTPTYKKVHDSIQAAHEIVERSYQAALPESIRLALNNLSQHMHNITDNQQKILNETQELLNLLKIESEKINQNRFTQIIDTCSNYCGVNRGRFHYLSSNCGFYGRDAQINELKSFLENDEEKVCIIYGTGGIGKSKLVYEFIKENEENCNNTNWKMVLADSTRIHNMLGCELPIYPKNLIIAIDYCSTEATKIGRLIRTLENTSSPFSVKFVLIDRIGVYSTGEHDTPVLPYWYDKLTEESGLLTETSVKWLQLKPLNKNDLFQMMDTFVESTENSSINDDDKEKIYKYITKSVDAVNQEVLPLYILIVTDAYRNGSINFEQANLSDILNHALRRTKLTWKGYFPNDTDTMLSSFTNLMQYATATGSINIGESIHAAFEEDLKRFKNYTSNPACNPLELHSDDMLHKLEPDIIGEYFVLIKLFSARIYVIESIVSAYWDKPIQFIEFLNRALQTYGRSPIFTENLKGHIALFIPSAKIAENCKEAVLSLLNSMMLYLEDETFRLAFSAFEQKCHNGQDSFPALPNFFTQATRTLAMNASAVSKFAISIQLYDTLLSNSSLSEEFLVIIKIAKAVVYTQKEEYASAILNLQNTEKDHAIFLQKNLFLSAKIKCELCYAKTINNEYKDNADTPEIEITYLTLMKQYEHQPNPNKDELANMWYTYAVYLCKKRAFQFEQAYNALNKTRDYCGDDNNMKMFIYNQFAICYDLASRKEEKKSLQYKQYRDEALCYFWKSLKKREQVFEHRETRAIARAQDNLARFMCFNNSTTEETLKLLEAAKCTFEKCFSAPHAALARNLFNLGLCYQTLNPPMNEHARDYFEKAKTMYKELPNGLEKYDSAIKDCEKGLAKL